MKPRTLIILATLALVCSRVPFFFDNPDWGRLHPEHCFVLSAPAVFDARTSLEPDQPLQYWLMNPAQIVEHYHIGSASMFHLVRWVSGLLGTRSLLVLKLIGTAFMAAYIALLAAALSRMWPRRRDRFMVVAPLFVGLFPPTFFLWISLTPQGHYFEYHLFYGMLLPFMVAGTRGRLSLPWLILAGTIAGVAAAYSISNALLVVVLMLAYLLGHDGRKGSSEQARSLSRRLAGTALLGVLSAVLVCVLARPILVYKRLTTSPYDEGPGSTFLGHGITVRSWITEGHLKHAFESYLDAYFGLSAHPLMASEHAVHSIWTTGAVGWTAAGGLALLALAAGAYLSWHAICFLLPGSRRRMSPRQRFVGIHGLLFVGSLGLAAIFEPYLTRYDPPQNMRYLVPVFPPLLVGAAALLHALRRHTDSRVKWAGNIAAAAAAVALLMGYVACLGYNSRPLERPDIGACDSIEVDGYFLENRESDFGARHAHSFDRVRGVERCQRALPGNDEACEFIGHAADPERDVYPELCSRLPEPHDIRCAQAYGASQHLGCAVSEVLPSDDCCPEFTGALREACCSGAYQGPGREWSDEQCGDILVDLCLTSFPDPAAYAACAEQASALLEGMPVLPSAPATPPDQCVSWPAPWHGLCARADALASLPAPAPGTRSCEDVYLETYADHVPEIGSLQYLQALAFAPESYPWLAVGIARHRGEVSCAWRGDFAPEADFFAGRSSRERRHPAR
jgi:hypothetical protein